MELLFRFMDVSHLIGIIMIVIGALLYDVKDKDSDGKLRNRLGSIILATGSLLVFSLVVYKLGVIGIIISVIIGLIVTLVFGAVVIAGNKLENRRGLQIVVFVYLVLVLTFSIFIGVTKNPNMAVNATYKEVNSLFSYKRYMREYRKSRKYEYDANTKKWNTGSDSTRKKYNFDYDSNSSSSRRRSRRRHSSN